jgi:hypothetical protein
MYLSDDVFRFVVALVPRVRRWRAACVNHRFCTIIMTSEYKHWLKAQWWDRHIGAWLCQHSLVQRGHMALLPPYTKAELTWKEARMYHRLPRAIRQYLKYVSREFAVGAKWFTIHLDQLTSRQPHEWRTLTERRHQRIEFQMATGLVRWKPQRYWHVARKQPSTFDVFLTPPAKSCMPYQRRYPVPYSDRMGWYGRYYCVSFENFQARGLVAQIHHHDVCLGLV